MSNPKSETTELSHEDILVLLCEEAAEVIQAATKCLRFGYKRNQPGYGNNYDVLAREIGDLMGCVDALRFSSDGREGMIVARNTKIQRATKFLNEVLDGKR